jgi:hypothetical protein
VVWANQQITIHSDARQMGNGLAHAVRREDRTVAR